MHFSKNLCNQTQTSLLLNPQLQFNNIADHRIRLEHQNQQSEFHQGHALKVTTATWFTKQFLIKK